MSKRLSKKIIFDKVCTAESILARMRHAVVYDTDFPVSEDQREIVEVKELVESIQMEMLKIIKG